MLGDLGASDVNAVSNVADALRVLETKDITFALLDVNLGSELSLKAAKECARGVFRPFWPRDMAAAAMRFPTSAESRGQEAIHDGTYPTRYRRGTGIAAVKRHAPSVAPFPVPARSRA